MMVRILSYVVLVFLLAAGFSWLADRPGDMVITWQGMRYQITLLVAVTTIAAIIAAVMLTWWLLRTLINSPTLITRHFRARKRDRGYQSLSTGIIAAGAGDSGAARAMAKQAGKLLNSDQEPLIKLLDAQATLLEGRTEEARKLFEAMVEDPETKLIGLRGLYLEAERLGDISAARHFAGKAAEVAPQLAWAGKVAMENSIASGDFDGAIKLLDAQKSSKIISKDEDRRRRAVLYTGKAMALVSSDANAARIAALEANRLAPELVPAATVCADALIKSGEVRKALRTLEYTYKMNPHPDLAEIYTASRGTDKPADCLKRAKTLASFAPGNVESDIAIARVALAAGQYDEARRAAEAALAKRPSEGVHLILADIEQAQTRSVGKVREHLARALRAPRDPAWTADGMVSQRWLPVSPVTGRVDAFEWKVPVERLSPAIDYVPEPIEDEPVIELKPVVEAKTTPVTAQPKLEAMPLPVIVTDAAAPRSSSLDPMSMAPDDPGVRQGTRANGAKRFKLF